MKRILSLFMLLVFPLCVVFAQEEEEEPSSAKIVCIGWPIVNANQSLGDVVSVFPGDHVFSPHEQSVFTIITVPNVSPSQVQEAIDFVTGSPGQEKKYLVSIANLTVEDIAFIEDENESLSDKIQLLRSKLKDNTQ